MIIDLGDTQLLHFEVRDPVTFVLTDATVVVTVTSPTNVVTTPSVTHTATGVYDASFLANEVGRWRWTWAATGAVADVESGEVTVADPAPSTYATLAQLKLAAGEIADSSRDSLLQVALASAARSVDRYCGRRFYADTTATARQFRTDGATVCAWDGELLFVDDLSSTTGLVVEVGDGTTFTAVTDYLTESPNAAANTWPITGLRRIRSLWRTNFRVRVTGLWGWPSIPDEVSQATLLQASRLFNRRKSPEGITGNAEWGVTHVTRVDPDVASLLQPYQILGVG